jgi:hypothetical protein
VIWRLFLALNELAVLPGETRGFEVDDEIQPIHHAKAGAGDLVLTYQDFTIVCEMTLTRGSRQFAAEKEPVTRHVASQVQECPGKPVYGLFVAPEIDPNTVDAFHKARYWTGWTKPIPTPVVALKVRHVIDLVRRVRDGSFSLGDLRGALDNILDLQDDYGHGPAWFRAYEREELSRWAGSEQGTA